MNGQYWGVYDLREKVDDKDFTNYYYNQNTPNVEMLQTWGGTWNLFSNRWTGTRRLEYIREFRYGENT